MRHIWIVIGLLLASLAMAQTPRPGLDGATLTLERDGVVERYRLSAQPDAPTPKPTPTPAPPTPKVPGFDLLLADPVAPAGAFVQALDLPFDPLTTRYDWDFGDPQSSRNKLPGFVAAHAYDRPGAYTITLTIRPENQKPLTLTRLIEIKPDNRRTVHVAPDGNDRNDGSIAHPLRSLVKAGEIATDDVKILLRRGATFDVDRVFLKPGRRVLIGAYGDAGQPRPVIRYTGTDTAAPLIRGSEKTIGLVVENITFDSQVGNQPGATALPDCVGAGGTQIVVRDCTFLNVSYGINGNAKPRGVLMERCDAPNIDGLRKYLAWIEGRDWTILDNRVANSTREHCIRAWGYSRLLIAFNDLANVNRKDIDGVDIAKNTVNLQAGEYVYLHGNTLRGPSSIGPLGKADGMKYKDQRSRCYVVENNRFERSPLEVQHGLSEAMIRENRFFVNDGRSIVLDGFDSDYRRGIGDITIVSNHSENNGTKGGFLYVGGAVAGIWLSGNCYVAPDLSPGANETAVVYVNDRDLGSFRAVENNRWPAGKPGKYAEGGVMYVWPKWSDPRGYLDAGEWSAISCVRGDRFE